MRFSIWLRIIRLKKKIMHCGKLRSKCLIIQEVVMSNGIVQVTLSNPGGDVIGISYNGIDNLLEIKNHEHNRG